MTGLWVHRVTTICRFLVAVLLTLTVLKISALAKESGSLEWQYKTKDRIISSPAADTDSVIYIGSADSYLYALRSDGTLLWRFRTRGAITSSPAIGSDGSIYIGSYDSYVYALRADGTLRWSFATGGAVRASPAVGADGTIYIGSDDSYLYAVNSDGTTKWVYRLGDSISTSPVIGNNGIIYAGSTDTYVYAINLDDGALRWRYKTGGKLVSPPAIGADGVIYVGSTDNYLYAIRPNGTLRWRYATRGPVESSPAIGTDGVAYVGSTDGYLYAIDSLGNLRWRFVTGMGIRSSPTIGADGTVYFGSHDSCLYAVHSDGRFAWKYRTGGVVWSSPLLERGIVYVGSWDGNLYAIHSNSERIAAAPWPMWRHDPNHTGNVVFRLKQPPKASFTFSPPIPSILDTVQFTDSSVDSDGQVANWEWNFGDGSSSYDQNPTHKYTQKRMYTVTLTVTDDDGLTDTATQTLTLVNLPPSATFISSPKASVVNQPISFDASSSTDKDGTITHYLWNFGDGTSGSGILVHHTYDRQGTFKVTLTVTDNGGLTDSTYKWVTVRKSNQPPIAQFTTYILRSTGERKVEIQPLLGAQVWFDASTSSDPDGKVVKYEWDWDSDGSYDVSSKDPVIGHIFTQSGKHSIALRVTDDKGATAKLTKMITVKENIPPIAAFTMSASRTLINRTVTFDASNSSDPDGRIVNYEWEFGDGTRDEGKIVTHAFSTEGTYTVKLTVTDNDGATASVEKEVKVFRYGGVGGPA